MSQDEAAIQEEPGRAQLGSQPSKRSLGWHSWDPYSWDSGGRELYEERFLARSEATVGERRAAAIRPKEHPAWVGGGELEGGWQEGIGLSLDPARLDKVEQGGEGIGWPEAAGAARAVRAAYRHRHGRVICRLQPR
mmetsp:Transcript_63987/g.142951  ORF Transcript_63987/g.142951 Transcript_63987/m.142951 type:complete len:136 (+) Transcript_63987:679-1086(+)